MNKIQSTIINKLLDKYESSKTFSGDNKKNQSFAVIIDQEFPKYKDDADYDYFVEVNDSVQELEKLELITIKERNNGTIERVLLNISNVEQCYSYVSRKSKRDEYGWLANMWENLDLSGPEFEPIQAYINMQKHKMEGNKAIEFYDGDKKKYEDLLATAIAVIQNKEEIYIRDFSISLFQDSKRVEQLASKVSSMLYIYGEFEEKESIFEECGIVNTPTYVMIKGNVKININGQILNVSKMQGDIAFSTVSMKELEDINVLGKRVVTIENLTSFHDYRNREDCVIYLGGFHNKTKRNFIKYVYDKNPNVEYRHFGDIDAGGFYILEHLKRKTGINFRSLYMDKETLMEHSKDLKKLTQNDRTRLNKLRDELVRKRKWNGLSEDYIETIDTMLTLNCKLEQESVRG